MSSDWDHTVELGARIDTGQVEAVPDPGHPNSWSLVVNGVTQSYVDLDRPGRLPMMYSRIIASVIDAATDDRRPVRVLHLGAGALTLPRYVAAARPGSRQLVVEIDRRLVEFVRFVAPLPADAAITVRIDDARAAAQTLRPRSFDLIINDVYRGAELPAHIGDTDFVALMAGLLDGDGLYLANILDAAGLVLTRRHLATIRTGFADTRLLTTARMWKGRRDGNLIIVATDRPGGVPVDRVRCAARSRVELVTPPREVLDRFVSGTAPL